MQTRLSELRKESRRVFIKLRILARRPFTRKSVYGEIIALV